MERENDRIEALEGEMRAMAAAFSELKSENQAIKRRVFRWRLAAGLAAVTAMVAVGPVAGTAQAGGTLEDRVAELEQKLQFQSVAGTEIYISGANVHLVNGMGQTATSNALGN